MAISKFLLASIAITLVIVGVRSDSSNEAEIVESETTGSSLRSELDALRSKIPALESSIEDKIREIRAKEDSISHLNTLMREKITKIASFEGEIKSLQKKGAVDAKKLAGKADARVSELEQQIVKLKNEIEVQSKKRSALEARIHESERVAQELSLKLESLQKVNEDQKTRIRKTQHTLELAEEELTKAQLLTTSKVKELTEVHGAWLPPWLLTQMNNIQDLAANKWNEHAKPALIVILDKASKGMDQVQNWAEPHLDSVKTKWIPAVSEQLLIFKSNAEPYVQKISLGIIEVYEASKSTVVPHIDNIKEVTYPYFEDARKFATPYIDQVVIVTKPHIGKIQLAFKPYMKHIARTYHKFLRRARTYHHQVQVSIHEKLKRYELTKPHATKELAWFMATALLAFPIIFLYRLLSATFCKKVKKPRRTVHSSHAHRRPKRRHADK